MRFTFQNVCLFGESVLIQSPPVTEHLGHLWLQIIDWYVREKHLEQLSIVEHVFIV